MGWVHNLGEWGAVMERPVRFVLRLFKASTEGIDLGPKLQYLLFLFGKCDVFGHWLNHLKGVCDEYNFTLYRKQTSWRIQIDTLIQIRTKSKNEMCITKKAIATLQLKSKLFTFQCFKYRPQRNLIDDDDDDRTRPLNR